MGSSPHFWWCQQRSFDAIVHHSVAPVRTHTRVGLYTGQFADDFLASKGFSLPFPPTTFRVSLAELSCTAHHFLATANKTPRPPLFRAPTGDVVWGRDDSIF